MIRTKILSVILSVVFCAQAVSAFAPKFSPMETTMTSRPIAEKVGQFVAVTTAAIATSPLVALAEEVGDEYEYGAVNAPIGIAWAGGVVLILTALLPLALQGGEEAFEEMKAKDADSWGSGRTDALNKKRR